MQHLRVASAVIPLFACVCLAATKHEVCFSDETVLRSQDGIARGKAVQNLAEERRRIVECLVQVAGSTPEADKIADIQAKHDAITLLGVFRAAEGADVLVAQVAYSPPLLISDEAGPLVRYPAAISLTQIGGPAIDAIRDRLQRDSPISEREMRIFSYILARIDGKDIGMYRLSRMRDEYNERHQDQRTTFSERLSTLIEYVDMIGTHRGVHP